MPIVWNDKARAQILPRTREAAGPFKPQKPETIWATVHKTFGKRGNYDPIEGTFVKGRSLATPEMAALMEKCEPFARSEEVPTIDDVDVAAAFFALGSKHAYTHMQGFLLATMPVARAFHALLRARDFGVTPQYTNWNTPFHLHAAPGDADAFDPEWRKILLAQPDEVRAECKRIAKDLWPRANLGQKTTIANAFFEEAAWAGEVCRAWVAKGLKRHVPLNDLVTDFELAKTMVKNKDGAWNYMPLIDRFGDAMLPVLIELADAPFDRWHARDVAEALAVFDDPRAAAAMVKLLNQASSRPHALAYFGKYPHHAAAALETVATMKGRAAKIAKEVLTGAQRAVTSAVNPEDEATPEELPGVLAQPPWLDAKKPRKPQTKLALERLDLPEAVDWQPGEKERALKLFPKPDKPASPETLVDYAEQRASNKFVDVVKHKNEALPDALVLEAWNAGQKTYGYGNMLGNKVMHILAKYGEDAYPGLSEFVEHFANGWGDAPFLMRVRSWRLALPFAEHVTHRRIGKLAWSWLVKHAELAVLSLVPVAFGDDHDEREHAERAFFRLKASGVDVVGIGSRYGKDAKAALEKLFSWDPLYDLPKTIPKLGPSWRPETLTRPRLMNGKPLSIDAMNTIATMLAFTPDDPPYAGIVQVKEACDPRSLAELSWETARSWEHAGHKKKEQWMLKSLVHLADDEVVRRLTPGMRPDFAVEVLEKIGTDAALMEMATIAGRTASQGNEWTLGGKIEKRLDDAAEARGVTKDELEEDLAPTADLDEDGALSLDFGPRKVKVGFDESLVPYVKNDAGTRGRALPPARKDDDPDKAERAKTIWKDLKEDVTVIASRRIKALERAMTTGRTWTRERFKRVWLDHSLMKHMARGVLWIDNQANVAFRVAEDGSLSNVEDAPHVLGERAKIGVAHPLKLPNGDVEKWRTIFEDYKVVQPFTQLGRTYANIDKAAKRVPWPMPVSQTTELGPHFAARGFKHGSWNKGKQTFLRELSSGGVLHVEVGFDKTKVTEGAIFFMRDGAEVSASDLDPIHLADAVYDIAAP